MTTPRLPHDACGTAPLYRQDHCEPPEVAECRAVVTIDGMQKHCLVGLFHGELLVGDGLHPDTPLCVLGGHEVVADGLDVVIRAVDTETTIGLTFADFDVARSWAQGLEQASRRPAACSRHIELRNEVQAHDCDTEVSALSSRAEAARRRLDFFVDQHKEELMSITGKQESRLMAHAQMEAELQLARDANALLSVTVDEAQNRAAAGDKASELAHKLQEELRVSEEDRVLTEQVASDLERLCREREKHIEELEMAVHEQQNGTFASTDVQAELQEAKDLSVSLKEQLRALQDEKVKTDEHASELIRHLSHGSEENKKLQLRNEELEGKQQGSMSAYAEMRDELQRVREEHEQLAASGVHSSELLASLKDNLRVVEIERLEAQERALEMEKRQHEREETFRQQAQELQDAHAAAEVRLAELSEVASKHHNLLQVVEELSEVDARAHQMQEHVDELRDVQQRQRNDDQSWSDCELMQKRIDELTVSEQRLLSVEREHMVLLERVEQIGDIEQRCVVLERRVADLNDAKAELAFARAELRDVQSELDDARAEITEAEGQIVDAEAHLIGARADLVATEAHIDGTKADLVDTQARLNSTKNELVDAGVRLGDARTDLAEKDAYLNEMRRELIDVEARVGDSKAELDAAEASVSCTRKELVDVKARLGDAKADLFETEANLEGTRSKLDVAMTELKGVTSECERLKVRAQEDAIVSQAKGAQDEQWRVDLEEALEEKTLRLQILQSSNQNLELMHTDLKEHLDEAHNESHLLAKIVEEFQEQARRKAEEDTALREQEDVKFMASLQRQLDQANVRCKRIEALHEEWCPSSSNKEESALSTMQQQVFNAGVRYRVLEQECVEEGARKQEMKELAAEAEGIFQSQCDLLTTVMEGQRAFHEREVKDLQRNHAADIEALLSKCSVQQNQITILETETKQMTQLEVERDELLRQLDGQRAHREPRRMHGSDVSAKVSPRSDRGKDRTVDSSQVTSVTLGDDTPHLSEASSNPWAEVSAVRRETGKPFGPDLRHPANKLMVSARLASEAVSVQTGPTIAVPSVPRALTPHSSGSFVAPPSASFVAARGASSYQPPLSYQPPPSTTSRRFLHVPVSAGRPHQESPFPPPSPVPSCNQLERHASAPQALSHAVRASVGSVRAVLAAVPNLLTQSPVPPPHAAVQEMICPLSPNVHAVPRAVVVSAGGSSRSQKNSYEPPVSAAPVPAVSGMQLASSVGCLSSATVWR